MPTNPPKLRPLWRCQGCGKTFVTRNMWHSCRRQELEALFEGCAPYVFRLYRKFERMVCACGPITITPQKRGIAFQLRVRALGCVPRKTYLRIGFAFRRPRKHFRFVKVQTYSPRFHSHWIVVRNEQELDAQVERWIREAYAVAAQHAPRR